MDGIKICILQPRAFPSRQHEWSIRGSSVPSPQELACFQRPPLRPPPCASPFHLRVYVECVSACSLLYGRVPVARVDHCGRAGVAPRGEHRRAISARRGGRTPLRERERHEARSTQRADALRRNTRHTPLLIAPDCIALVVCPAHQTYTMTLAPTPPSDERAASARSGHSRVAVATPASTAPPAPWPPLNPRLYHPPASAPPSTSKLLSRPFGYLAAPTPPPAPAPAVVEPLSVANLAAGVLSLGAPYTSNLHARSDAYISSRRAIREAKRDQQRLKATLDRERAQAALAPPLPDFRPPDYAFDEYEEADEIERERILASSNSPTRIIARREHPWVPRVYLAEEQVLAQARARGARAAGGTDGDDSPTTPDSPVKVDHFGLLHSFQLQLTRPANLPAAAAPAAAAAAPAPAVPLPTKQPLILSAKSAAARPSLDFAGVAFSALPATAANSGISALSAFVNLRAAAPAAAAMVLSVAGAEHARKTSTLPLPGGTANAQHHPASSLSINVAAPFSASVSSTAAAAVATHASAGKDGVSAAAAAPSSPSNAAAARSGTDGSTAGTAAAVSTGLAAPSATSSLAAPSGASALPRSSSSSSVGGAGSSSFNLPVVLKGSPGFHYMPKARDGGAGAGRQKPLSRAEERRREKEFEREKRELAAFLLGTDTATTPATAPATNPAATAAVPAPPATSGGASGHTRTLSFAKTHAPPRSARSRSRSRRKPVSPPAKIRPSSSAAAAGATPCRLPPNKPSMASILTGASDASRAAAAALAAANAAAQTARDASPLRYMHTSRTATSPVRHVLRASSHAANAHTTLTLQSKRQLEHDRKARLLFEQVTSGIAPVEGGGAVGDGATSAGSKFGFGLDLSVEEVARNSKQEQRLISGLLTAEASAAATIAALGPSTLLRSHTSAARSGSDGPKEGGGGGGSGSLSKQQLSGALASGGVAGSSSVQGSAMLGTVDESSQTSSSKALPTADSAAAAASSKEQRARDSAVAAGEFTPLSPELVNALVKATKRGDATMISDLIAQCPEHQRLEFINMKDKNGSTAIFHTVWPGHFFALRMLLQRGADPNIQNVKKNTALHLAVERGHKNLIRCLLEYKADPTLRNAADLLCFQTPANPEDRVLMERFIANTAAEVKRGTVSTYKLDMSSGFLASRETNPFVSGYYSAAWRRATDPKWGAQATEPELKEALEWTPPVPSAAGGDDAAAAAEEQSLTHNGVPHPSQYELRLAPWFGKFVSRSLRAAEHRAGTLPPTEEQMHRAWARRDRRARRKARREERRAAKEKQAAAGFGSPPSTAASKLGGRGGRESSPPRTATATTISSPGFSAPSTAAYRMRNKDSALQPHADADGDPNAEHFPANPSNGSAGPTTATEDDDDEEHAEVDPAAATAATTAATTAAEDATVSTSASGSAAKPPLRPRPSSSSPPQFVAATISSRPSSGRVASPSRSIALAAPGPHSNTSAATATFAFLPQPPRETLGAAQLRVLPARASWGVELMLANRPSSASGEDRAVAAVNVPARVQKQSMTPQSPRVAASHSQSQSRPLELDDLAASSSSLAPRHFAAPPGDAVHDLERSRGQPVGDVSRASFVPPISARLGDAHEAASVLAPPWGFSDDSGASARWATELSSSAQPVLGAQARPRMTSDQLAEHPPPGSGIAPSVYPEHFPFHASRKAQPRRSMLTPPSVVAKAVEMGILEDAALPLAGVAPRKSRSQSVSPSRKQKQQRQAKQEPSSMLVDAALRAQGAEVLSSARALTGVPPRESLREGPMTTVGSRRSASYGGGGGSGWGEPEEKQPQSWPPQHHPAAASKTAVRPGSVQWHAQQFAELPATRPSAQQQQPGLTQVAGSMSARTSTAPAHASRTSARTADAESLPLFSSFAVPGRPSTSAGATSVAPLSSFSAAKRPPRPLVPQGSALVGAVVSPALAAPMPPSVTVLQEGREFQFAAVQQQQPAQYQLQQTKSKTSHAIHRRRSAGPPPARPIDSGAEVISRRFKAHAFTAF